MWTHLHRVLLLMLAFAGAASAVPPPPADRIHDPERLLDAEQRRALATQLAGAAAHGADLWVVTSSTSERKDIQPMAASFLANWGRSPLSAVLVQAPLVRPQPFVHAGGVDVHLFDAADLQEQLNGALLRALALQPGRPLEAAVDAMATELAILDRRLTRQRQRNLTALAASSERIAPPAPAPHSADSFLIPALAVALALASLAGLAAIITRQSRKPRHRYFPGAGFRPRFDAPFSGGSDFTRDLPRRNQ